MFQHLCGKAEKILSSFSKWRNQSSEGLKWSRSVVYDSLQPHGLWPTRPLCPWDFPGKSTGVGCHLLLQGIFLTQWSNLGLLPCRQMLYSLSHPGFNSAGMYGVDPAVCCVLTLVGRCAGAPAAPARVPALRGRAQWERSSPLWTWMGAGLQHGNREGGHLFHSGPWAVFRRIRLPGLQLKMCSEIYLPQFSVSLGSVHMVECSISWIVKEFLHFPLPSHLREMFLNTIPSDFCSYLCFVLDSHGVFLPPLVVRLCVDLCGPEVEIVFWFLLWEAHGC